MAGRTGSRRPTLKEIESWPATVSVEAAAAALGVSRAHAYECVRAGTFPVRTITVGGRIAVLTYSLVSILTAEPAA